MSLLVSIDIEATGCCPSLHSCVMIGVVVVRDDGKFIDMNTFNTAVLETKQWCIKEYRGQEQRCMDEFWTKNKDVWDYIKANECDVTEVMQEFATWLRGLLLNNKVRFMAKPASYDWAWITDLYHSFGPADKVNLPFSVQCLSTLWRTAESLFPDHIVELADYVKNDNLVHTHYAVDDAMLQCFVYLRIQQFMKNKLAGMHKHN